MSRNSWDPNRGVVSYNVEGAKAGDEETRGCDCDHQICCELILFCIYLKYGTLKWKAKCISNRCAPPYPSIKGHREKSPKRTF